MVLYRIQEQPEDTRVTLGGGVTEARELRQQGTSRIQYANYSN